MMEGVKATSPTVPSRRILAFPFHDWRKLQAEGFRTRDAHLLQAFVRRDDVEPVERQRRTSPDAAIAVAKTSAPMRNRRSSARSVLPPPGCPASAVSGAYSVGVRATSVSAT